MAARNSKASSRKPTPTPTAGPARSRASDDPAATATAKAKANTVASQLPQVGAAKIAAAKKKFEQGILSRGEAVPAGKPLPAGATHEIVDRARDGSPILKRKRFSIT